MNIAVCEDRKEDQAALCAYIQEYCRRNSYAGQCTAFSSGEELLEDFIPGKYDLIFLDIVMPGLSGVELARKIREVDRDCMLVFVTMSPEFAMDGFLVHAAGYVVKPISEEKMQGVMHACRHEFDRNSRLIEVPQGGDTLRVSVADLIYAEVYSKETVLHMKRGRITTRLPLDEVEAKLGGVPFLRCHRSYLINMNYVDDMRGNDFLMRNGDVVPMRINGRKQVRMAMAGFTAKSPMEAS
jgi:DNA-binding LytR/AlgR family response regulator